MFDYLLRQRNELLSHGYQIDAFKRARVIGRRVDVNLHARSRRIMALDASDWHQLQELNDE